MTNVMQEDSRFTRGCPLTAQPCDVGPLQLSRPLRLARPSSLDMNGLVQNHPRARRIQPAGDAVFRSATRDVIIAVFQLRHDPIGQQPTRLCFDAQQQDAPPSVLLPADRPAVRALAGSATGMKHSRRVRSHRIGDEGVSPENPPLDKGFLCQTGACSRRRNTALMSKAQQSFTPADFRDRRTPTQILTSSRSKAGKASRQTGANIDIHIGPSLLRNLFEHRE